MASRVQGLPHERVIALCRLALVAFGLFAIYLDPSDPASNAPIVTAILTLYLLYAVFILILLNFLNIRKFLTLVHLIDVFSASAIIVLTNAPFSPFFVFFTFVIVTGTLRWGWAAGITTTFVALCTYVVLSLGTWAHQELNVVIIRTGFLLVFGALVGYLGVVLAHARRRIASLARWPVEDVVETDFPTLDKSLAHAAETIGAGIVVAAWELRDEPFRYQASFNGGQISVSRHPGMSGNARPSSVEIGESRTESMVGTDIPELEATVRELLPREQRAGAVHAAFATRSCRGHLALADFDWTDDDLWSLAEIIGNRFANEIEHHLLRRHLLEAVELRERAKLARDVHDGLLQSLTATALQLKNLQSDVDDTVRTRLSEISAVVTAQQDRLREFVSWGAGNVGADPLFSVRPELREILDEIELQWGCTSNLSVDPPDAEISRRLGVQICLLVSEAAANSVRHGGAESVNVDIVCLADQVVLRVCDDGTGIPGVGDNAEPGTILAREVGSRSLRERIDKLSGRLSVSSSGDGTNIEMELPVR